MAQSDLETLLNELARTSSPVERVRVLSRAWRALSRLTPGERLLLARRTGLARAEDLLERLARGRGRLTPSLLLQAVRQAKDADPGKVSDLVRRLRDPQARAELLKKGLEDGLDALSDSPDGQEQTSQPDSSAAAVEPEAEEPDSKEQPPRQAPREQSPERWSEPPPWLVSARLPSAAAATAAVAAARPSGSAEVKHEPPEDRPVPVVETPKPVVPAPAAPAPPASTETPPVAVPQSRATVPAPTAPEPVEEPMPAAPDVEGLREQLEAAGSTMKRLRLLHRRARELTGADIDDLRRVIGSFPDGWSRRRAVSSLFEAGVPRDVHRAALLIEQLASPTARRWCASVLLDNRDLLPREREALIDKHRLFGRRRRAPSQPAARV